MLKVCVHVLGLILSKLLDEFLTKAIHIILRKH